MPVGALHVKGETRLRICQTGGAAEWNCVEVRRLSAVDCLEERVVRAQHHGAVVVVWQTFRVIAYLVWVEILILIVWMLQVLRRGLQTGIGCVAPELGAGIGALIRAGSGFSFTTSDYSCGDGCGANTA